MTFAIFSFFGCTTAQKKELVSVDYHRSGMSRDDRIFIQVKKTAETYFVEFEEGSHEENSSTRFEITQNDFDSLANIVSAMNRLGIKTPWRTLDLSEHLNVNFIKNGKEISHRYSNDRIEGKKTMKLQNQVIGLLYRWIDKHKQKGEIRVPYSKGIATPTKIYTYAEPAELVQDLGVFTERLGPSLKSQCGGRDEYSHRWRALRPGVVTIWLQELGMDYDASKLSEEFEPYGCYIIDENLNVHYSKEKTEIAREKYKP